MDDLVNEFFIFFYKVLDGFGFGIRGVEFLFVLESFRDVLWIFDGVNLLGVFRFIFCFLWGKSLVIILFWLIVFDNFLFDLLLLMFVKFFKVFFLSFFLGLFELWICFLCSGFLEVVDCLFFCVVLILVIWFLFEFLLFVLFVVFWFFFSLFLLLFFVVGFDLLCFIGVFILDIVEYFWCFFCL